MNVLLLSALCRDQNIPEMPEKIDYHHEIKRILDTSVDCTDWCDRIAYIRNKLSILSVLAVMDDSRAIAEFAVNYRYQVAIVKRLLEEVAPIKKKDYRKVYSAIVKLEEPIFDGKAIDFDLDEDVAFVRDVIAVLKSFVVPINHDNDE